jgi:hypothetical protein
MAKAAATIQAPLHKFLYGGRMPSVQALDSLKFTTDQSNVKTEEEWYDFATVAIGASGLEASNVPATSNSPTPSGSSSDCVVLETLSTPAKAKAPDFIMFDPTIVNPAHECQSCPRRVSEEEKL